MFSCEFCEISKNIFFYRIPPKDCFSIYTVGGSFLDFLCAQLLNLLMKRQVIIWIKQQNKYQKM